MKLTIGNVSLEVPDTMSTKDFTDFLQNLFTLQDKLAAFVSAMSGQASAAGGATTQPAATAQLSTGSVAIL